MCEMEIIRAPEVESSPPGAELGQIENGVLIKFDGSSLAASAHRAYAQCLPYERCACWIGANSGCGGDREWPTGMPSFD